MNRLKYELDQFWIWAGITADDYKAGIMPIHAKRLEWEDYCPNWELLIEEIDHSMIDLNQSWNDDLADLLVIAISLDNGKIFELCLEGVKDIDRLMETCFLADKDNHSLKMAQRIMGLIGENDD